MVFWHALFSAFFGVFRYSGRADRVEQWTFTLVTALLGLAHYQLLDIGVVPPDLVALAMKALWVWIAAAHVSLMVRRLHDHGRSGFILLIPVAGLSIALVGHVGEAGEIDVAGPLRDVLMSHGWFIERAGWLTMFLSFSMLAGVFVGEGDADENKYGDPV